MYRRFQDLSIGKKLWLILGSGLLGLMVAAAYSLYQFKHSMIEERKARAQSVVEASFGILEHFNAEAAANRMELESAQRAAVGLLQRMRYGNDSYIWVTDMSARVILAPFKSELTGKDMSDYADPSGKRIFLTFVDMARSDGAGFVEYLWPEPFKDNPTRKASFVKAFPPWGWVVGSGVYLDGAEAAVAAEAKRILGVALALTILLYAAATALARSVSTELSLAVDAARRLSQGDMTVRIDEVTADEPGQLLGAMKATIDKHSRVLGDVRSAADVISASSDRVTAIARSVQQGSRDQATGSAQSALTMQRMCASLEVNRDVARSTERLTARAAREAIEGREAIQEAAKAVQQISEKILVIHEIAHKTTLLAHEFSIEETRSGGARASAEAAEHVRQLYEQTRAAAQEIGMLAGGSAALVNKACRYLEAIVPAIDKASHQAQTVSAGADEATSHARKITEAESRLHAISQEHAASAESLSGEAAVVRRRAQELQALVAYFTLEAGVSRPSQPALSAVATTESPTVTPRDESRRGDS